METDETKQRITKTKEKILKIVKDSIAMEEIVNEDFEKTSNIIKSQDEAVDAFNNLEKIIRSN